MPKTSMVPSLLGVVFERHAGRVPGSIEGSLSERHHLADNRVLVLPREIRAARFVSVCRHAAPELVWQSRSWPLVC